MSDTENPTTKAPITFGRSRTRLAQGFVLSGVLIVAGLGIALLAGDQGDGTLWSGALLGTIGLVVLVQALWTARDPSPWLVIDERGLWYKEWGLPPVPWSEIENHYQTGSRMQAYLAVALLDQEATFAGLAERRGQSVRFGRLIRPGRLLIPANTLDGNFRQIQNAIERFAGVGARSSND